MNVDQGTAGADVKIRSSGVGWAGIGTFAAIWLVFVVLRLTTDYHGTTSSLVFGFLLIVELFWLQTFGAELSREYVMVRGVRSRRIPWQEVQAVLPDSQLGMGRVSLILDGGKRVMLPAPKTFLGIGGAAYARDLHLVEECWVANRGDSWRLVKPQVG
jgi:hypothetical protein